VAAALEAGLPTSRAVVVVQSAVDLVSATSGPADPAGSGPDWSGPGTDLADALDLAEATGAGPAPLVRRAASRRRQARTAAQVAAARRMGVLLVLPTGLCFLPAFVALGVVPVILDLLAN
jgi:tight adherence protein B